MSLVLYASFIPNPSLSIAVPLFDLVIMHQGGPCNLEIELVISAKHEQSMILICSTFTGFFEVAWKYKCLEILKTWALLSTSWANSSRVPRLSNRYSPLGWSLKKKKTVHKMFTLTIHNLTLSH